MGRRHSVTLLPETLEMKRNGLAHGLLDGGARAARSDTARKVWRECRITCLGFLDDDEVSHAFNPACLNILLSVPGAKSNPGLPAIVTSPGFLSCLNWR